MISGRNDFYEVGNSVKYKCPTGYKLINGEEVRTCISNGRWSGSAPKCKYVDCGEIPQGKIPFHGDLKNLVILNYTINTVVGF